MKARSVKGLDPAGPLADNLERIVRVRLDELCGFAPPGFDPEEVVALHDMRIAAKRLRYILEVGAEPCFGSYAVKAGKRAKELQDLLGEIHDCDVTLPRVLAMIDGLRAADAREAVARAGDADDLDPAHWAARATRPRGVASRRSRCTWPPAGRCSSSASWRSGATGARGVPRRAWSTRSASAHRWSRASRGP